MSWVVVGSALVVATLAGLALRVAGVLPAWVSVSGPFVTVHSARGRALLDWLARPRETLRRLGTAGLVVVVATSVVVTAGVLFAGVVAATRPESNPISSPTSALVVPGVNDFLPLAAAPAILFGVLVGLVVHEGAHGVFFRVADVDVDSLGIALLGPIPLGAFVQPGEEPVRHLRGWARAFAAGPASNLVVTAVVVALLAGPVLGSISPVAGVAVGGVVPASAAADAGIQRGDVVTGVNGTAVGNASDLDAALAATGPTVQVNRHDAPAVTVRRRVTVVAVDGGPTGLRPGATVRAVNGTAVHTERAFRAALANRSIARLRVGDRTVTAPMGVAARVVAGGSLARAGVSPNASVVLTSVDGRRVLDAGGIAAALSDRDPGETVPVTAVVNGTRRTLPVALGGETEPLVGVVPRAGTSGLTVTDLGVGPYPAGEFRVAMGWGGLPGERTLPERLLVAILLPVAGVAGLAADNFAGFLGPVRGFYEVTGPLAGLGDGAFLLADVLFWTGWLNVQLALFNCIPLYPLDGGRLLALAGRAVGERRGTDPERAANVVVAGVGAVLLAALLALFLVPIVLG